MRRTAGLCRTAKCDVERLGGKQNLGIIKSIKERDPIVVIVGVDQIVDRRGKRRLFERVAPANEPCQPRHLLAVRVNQIFVKD